MSVIQMIPCVSSQIAAFGYDPASQTLAIQYLSSGAPYHYFDVPQATFDGLVAAESKGSFVIHNVKRAPFRFERQPELKVSASAAALMKGGLK